MYFFQSGSNSGQYCVILDWLKLGCSHIQLQAEESPAVQWWCRPSVKPRCPLHPARKDKGRCLVTYFLIFIFFYCCCGNTLFCTVDPLAFLPALLLIWCYRHFYTAGLPWLFFLSWQSYRMASASLLLAIDMGFLCLGAQEAQLHPFDLWSSTSLTKSQPGRHATFMALFRSVPELWKQPFSFCFWVSQIKASWMCFSYMKMYGRAWAKDLRTKAVSLKATKGTETNSPVSITGDGAHADITVPEESSRSSRTWLRGLVGNCKLA